MFLFCQVFEPVVQAMDILQGEGADGEKHPNLGAGYLLPTLRILLAELDEMSSGGGAQPLKICQPLAQALAEAIRER
jgi:hypothetical protein